MSQQPFPTPTPVTPLNYSHAASYHGRPRILTAIGVISIVIACVSGLSSLGGAFGAGMYYTMSKMPAATMAPPPAPVPARAPTPAAPPTTVGATTAPGVQTMQVTAYAWSAGGGGTAGVVATTGPATATTAPAVVGSPFGNINPVAIMLSGVAELLSLGLAILLLVAGVQTLRNAPSAARLHRWYAMMKIPLVIGATAAAVWLSSSMMKSMMASMPAGVPASAYTWRFMAASAVVPALFALGYPVALLIALRSRPVREYYNAVRAAGEP